MTPNPHNIVLPNEWFHPTTGWNLTLLGPLTAAYGVELGDGNRVVLTLLGRRDGESSNAIRAAATENEIPTPTTDGRWMLRAVHVSDAALTAYLAGRLSVLVIVLDEQADELTQEPEGLTE